MERSSVSTGVKAALNPKQTNKRIMRGKGVDHNIIMAKKG